MKRTPFESEVYFKASYLLDYFREHPDVRANKKGMEIWVGLLFSLFFCSELGNRLQIGFPLSVDAKKLQHPIDMQSLLRNLDAMDDKDVDIVLSEENHRESGSLLLQITRYVNREGTNDLIGLLKRKFQFQPDNNIMLLVYIEEDLHLALDPVFEFLGTLPVPYGKIYIIGNTLKDDSSLKLLELYPNPSEIDYDDISVRI